MKKEEQKVKEQSAYIWVDEYSRTKITLCLEDFFKVFSGKEITLSIK